MITFPKEPYDTPASLSPGADVQGVALPRRLSRVPLPTDTYIGSAIPAAWPEHLRARSRAVVQQGGVPVSAPLNNFYASPSRRGRALRRSRQALDGSSAILGLAGTALVFASIMPAGGIVAAIGMSIHLLNNGRNYATAGDTRLATFFKRSMFVAGSSALMWSLLALFLGASNPIGWSLLIIGHVGLAAAFIALVVKHRRLGLRAGLRQSVQDCWKLMFPDHRPQLAPLDGAAHLEMARDPWPYPPPRIVPALDDPP